MATPLDKLVVRESTETVDDRNILVALTEDQRISFRLKGMKSGASSIPIKELYAQLAGTVVAKPKVSKTVSQPTGEVMIPLSRLRILNATTPGKIELVARLDELIVEILEELKNEKA